MLERVVIVLAIILDGDRLTQIAELNHHLRIVLVDFDGRDVFDDCFDFLEHVRHQDRMIGRQKAARLLNDRRMGNVFVIAHLFDGIDDIVGKFL